MDAAREEFLCQRAAEGKQRRVQAFMGRGWAHKAMRNGMET